MQDDQAQIAMGEEAAESGTAAMSVATMAEMQVVIVGKSFLIDRPIPGIYSNEVPRGCALPSSMVHPIDAVVPFRCCERHLNSSTEVIGVLSKSAVTGGTLLYRGTGALNNGVLSPNSGHLGHSSEEYGWSMPCNS